MMHVFLSANSAFIYVVFQCCICICYVLINTSFLLLSFKNFRRFLMQKRLETIIRFRCTLLPKSKSDHVLFKQKKTKSSVVSSLFMKVALHIALFAKSSTDPCVNLCSYK